MVSLGTMALEDGGRVDFTRLRQERQRRVMQVMEEHDIDVLVLGREPNARYVSGARRLHLSGTRPFGPGCVVVPGTGQVHLMSTWDDGIPPEIPHEHLYGLSWNPMNLVASIQKIDGLSDAQRIGVDCMTPLFRQLMSVAAPSAQLVNAEALLRSVRATKTADELYCIKTAVAIAESSLTAVVDELRPGVRERSLQGTFEARMTHFGITTPATEGFFCAARPFGNDQRARIRRIAGDYCLDDGDLVVCAGGVLYSGYEGSVGRTWLCSARPGRPASDEQRDLYRRWSEIWMRIVDACKPGATGADLVEAYARSGESPARFPIAYSVGLGYEGVIAGSGLGPAFDAKRKLEPGMVLGVQAGIEGRTGAYFALETVHITPDGLEVLSAMDHGPLTVT